MDKTRKFAHVKAGSSVAKGSIIPIAVGLILTNGACLAQIIPDATLGNQNSRITTGVNIKEHGADLIEGGAQRGSSLFHSFAEFNVNNGQRVYFANPTGVDNIFSRVTGNNASNILGTLGVNGAANLFLLNPSGIIFGKDAKLDIQGSFLATTANSFKFPDGSEFSTTNPQAPPLLTMSVPVGVQYGLQPTASITNQGNLVTGKDLTLSAGNLDLQGTLQAGGNLILQAQDTLKVRDSASNPFIAAAGGKLLLQGNQKVDIFALNHPDSGFFSGGDMVLRSSNTVGGDAHYWAGGNFRIEQLNGDLGNLFSPDDPVIRASGDVSFDSYTGASLQILAGGSVNISGNVTIIDVDSTSNFIQKSVTLSDGETLEIDGSATPTLDIRAGVDFKKIGNPGFTPNPLIGFTPQNPQTTNTPTSANISIKGGISNISGAQSNSGEILITNKYEANKELTGHITIGEIKTYGDVSIDSRVNITTNGQINTTSNNKIAGNVNIQAVGDISVFKNIEASSNSNETGFNYIKINSNSGSVYLNNSKLDTTNAGSGFAGNIEVDAQNEININNSQLLSKGNLGQIFIGSQENYPIQVIINNKSILNTDLNPVVIKTGTAGYIRIYSQTKFEIKDSQIFTGIGDPNNQKNTNNNITGQSKGNNNVNGGTVEITSKGLVSLDNSQIYNDIFSKYAQGEKGQIHILARSLIMTNKSKLDTSTYGEGDAGDVKIEASDSVRLINNSEILSSVKPTGKGKGGNINITTHSLTLTDKGKIEAKSEGQGNAGDINIKTQNLQLRRQSNISTTANTQTTTTTKPGKGGDITINAENGFVVAVPTEDSNIIANSFGGKGGTIKITANRVLGFKNSQNRGKLTSAQLNNLESNGISDISASSDIADDGEVSINTLSIDPSQGLVALPTTLIDPSNLIAQGCGSSNGSAAKGQSEFVITGRGGLPPSPDDTLKDGTMLPEWVAGDTVKYSNNSENMKIKEMNLRQLSSNTPPPLVEAVGMVRSANGEIVLTAQPTTATLLQSGLSTKVCGVVQGNFK